MPERHRGNVGWLPISLVAVAVIVFFMMAGASGGIRLAVLYGPIFDDFAGPAGSPPDSAIWGYDVGGGGWGSNELQVYTDSTENAYLDGQGHLLIQARRTPSGYTSARLVTRGKAEFQYGTITARIQFPSGQGLVPAFWLLGSDIAAVDWPKCGEIDVMELPNVGTTYNSSLHGPLSTPQAGSRLAQASGPAGGDLTAGFHDYWVRRQPGEIRVGVDGVTHALFTPQSLPPGGQWVFDKPMFALLSVAVGGDWPGPPDESTPFPATMLVDWLRYTPE
jgi:beta-glucanase (GH16 family)